MSKKSRPYVLAGLLAAAVLILLMTRITISGRYEGVYLLHGQGKPFELKDDIFLGDGYRVIFALDLDDPRFHIFHRRVEHKPGSAYIDFEWDPLDGSGYVWNYMPGGKKMLTCFSRFKSSTTGGYVHGLFVGGGLPSEVHGNNLYKMNETGMAYYDGKRWDHVWCNVNEGISSEDYPMALVPSQWEFLESKVVHASYKSLVLKSSHRVIIDGVPLFIDRYAYFTAGDTYFILSFLVANAGVRPITYYYQYGDEPWLGNYGSSEGNVGWIKDSLIKYETSVDPARYSYAGYFDYGNDAIGEEHKYTNVANFIEWLGDNRPGYVYFSNGEGDYPDETKKAVALSSSTRFLGLQWGPKTLAPGDSDTYTLAIGMAGNDPRTGFPVKPAIMPNHMN